MEFSVAKRCQPLLPPLILQQQFKVRPFVVVLPAFSV
jgi:hypothetical protein